MIHGSEGVRCKGGRRNAVRRQDDAQVDRDWPEEGISAVSSVSSVRRTNASRRQEQLRVSSSEESTRRPRGGFRERRLDATGRGVGSACCGDSTSRSNKLHSNRLHQTCGPVNQQRHVCVEKCPLTMRHVAKRSGDSCGESQQSFGGIATRRPRRNTRSTVASVFRLAT